jgi:putative membrane protein
MAAGHVRFDPGLQPERTALAWRRTSLNIAVGGLLSMRLLPEVLGRLGFALGLAGVVAGLGLASIANRRERQENAFLIQGAGSLPDGQMLLWLALAVTTAGIVAALAVFLWLSGDPSPLFTLGGR